MLPTLTLEERQERLQEFLEVFKTLEADFETDDQESVWHEAKAKIQPYVHALFYGAHFTIYKDNPDFGSFYLRPPNAIEEESYWEDWARDILKVFGAQVEKSYFYPKEHIQNVEAQIHRRLCLYQTLLSMGAVPSEDSFGYEEWLSSIPRLNGKPQFPINHSFNSFLYQRYEKKLEQEKNGTLPSYTEEHDLSGYCPWGQKESVKKKLQYIVEYTPVLDIKDPHIKNLFQTGDIYKVAQTLSVFKERQLLDTNIQSVEVGDRPKTNYKI